MNAPLYTTAILRLAASIPHQARLGDAHATAERRSVVCGSRVTVDVKLGADGRVAALGQQVEACALGQASAAIMGAHAIGRSADELAAASDALAAFLAGARGDPGGWPGIETLAAARHHTGRHPAIRLPFEAIAAAARAAQR